MSELHEGIPLSRLADYPPLSLTHVQWVTEMPAEDDPDCLEDVQMFDVVGEQYRIESVQAAVNAIAEEAIFQPARFWLTPDNGNAHDPNAVAVYATASGRAYHVGFLPRNLTELFRLTMETLGRHREPLEVLGCITGGRVAAHPNARLYLPINFGLDVMAGYVDDPANQPEWLVDTNPIPKRPPTRRGENFTDIELCKIYSRYAKTRLWYNFPGGVEDRVAGFRSSGLGAVGEALPLYFDESEEL